MGMEGISKLTGCPKPCQYREVENLENLDNLANLASSLSYIKIPFRSFKFIKILFHANLDSLVTPRLGQASIKKYEGKHFTGSSAFPTTSRRQIWNRNCSYSPCGPCPTRRGRFCEQQWPGCKLDVRFEVEHLIYTFSSLVSSVERHKVLLLENQVLQSQLNSIHRWLTLAAPWGSFWDFPFWDFLTFSLIFHLML